jgi:hypothetical protein
MPICETPGAWGAAIKTTTCDTPGAWGNGSTLGLGAGCWWSKVLPTAALATPWPRTDSAGNDRYYKRITPSIINPTRAADDADNFVYTLYANAPGTTTEKSDYQQLDDKRHALFLTAEQTFRVVMCREPLLVRNSYQYGTGGALHGVRLTLYKPGETELVGVLTQGPGKVLSFDGSAVSLIADLSAFSDFTPLDFAFLDNRFYVVMQPNEGAPASALPHIRVVDLDNADKPYRILPDENNSPLTAIATFDSKLWIAATTGENESTIYAFDSSNLQQPIAAASTPIVLRFDTRNGATSALRAACEGGQVYEISEDGAELVTDTAQAEARSLFGDGAMIYAGTSSAGKLFTNRGGSWHEEKDFSDWSGVLALAAYRTSPHAGGDSARLYQRRDGVWMQVDELDNVSSINDMLEYSDRLVMATSNGGSQAFLHTRTISSKQGVIAREVPQVAFGLELRD